MKMKKRSNGSSMKKRKGNRNSTWSKKKAHPTVASIPAAFTSDEMSITPVQTAFTPTSIPPPDSSFCTFRDVYLSGSRFYTPDDHDSIHIAAILRRPRLLLWLHLVWGWSRRLPNHHHHVHLNLPLHHQHELQHLPFHQPLQLPLHPRVFNKQSDCAMVITEIMKAYFIEAHPSFRKVPQRMKNMFYKESGIDGTGCMSVSFGTLGKDRPHYNIRT
ncbi:hypothetical protein M9H77_35897 [Catharanthus roseus]|uniref:Uncharacterized protein n=1 Tax=Catharanthus roseus TaxID=4058 RepID=A0ACB9ZUJ8_CATRO|nr:hypothetical protein M9H77_35897 [Catharanthus roseus]